MRWISLAVVVSSALAGCSSAEPSGPQGRLNVATAPLTLTAVGNACYGLTVKNAAGQVVWQKGGICADGYGDNTSAVSYIGTCDASAGNEDHTVELVLEGLYDDGGNELHDFVNPAPAGKPIIQHATCVENADASVVFNLVVARAANQGFIDAAVNFEDVFCSAKLDCDAGDLLADPVSGARLPSAVVGLACTAGPGTDTHIYYSAVSLVCDGQAIDLSLAHAPGNFFSATSPAPSPLAQVASYHGVEQLTNPDGTSLAKSYFNLAFALPANATADCSLSFTATVSDGPLDGCDTPAATVYPVIHFSAPTFVSDGAFACGKNPLDGTTTTGVSTGYTDPAAPEHFAVEAHAVNGALAVDSCAFCGDGRVAAGSEACDPPSTDLACAYGETSCDRCSATCQLTPGTVTGYCGDGTLQSSEEGCDPPSTDLTCPYGETSCERCSSTCELVSGTPTGYCGDGVVQSGLETCDPPSGSLDCAPGVTSCNVCSATCQTVPGNPGPPVTPLVLSNGAPNGCVPQNGTSPHCLVAKVSCDDDCEIYVDGVKRVDFQPSLYWWNQRTVILDGITSGCHVLGVRTKDVYNVAAGFVGDITLDPVGTSNSAHYVTAQTDAITVSATAPVDAQGDTWSELDYDPTFPTAIQCTSTGTWNQSPWYTWGHQYYDHGAYPIWYNAACAGEHTEAFARIVFTVPENGTICDPSQGGVSTDGGQSWSSFSVPVCGDGTVDLGEQCDPPSPAVNDCPYGQTCTGCDPTCKTASYRGPYCGDGLVTDAEQCDGTTATTCADLDPTKPYGTVTCGACHLVANCSADNCFGQPTTYNGDVTIFGDQAPFGIDHPECITTITGNVTIAETVAFPASPVIRFPKLATIYNAATGSNGRLWILNWPDNVELFPALTTVETISLSTLSGKHILLPKVTDADPSATDTQTGLEVGVVGYPNATDNYLELGGMRSASLGVGTTSVRTTLDFGAALTKIDVHNGGAGTVVNLPSTLSSIFIFTVSGGSLAMNATGLRSLSLVSLVSGSTITGLGGVTTLGSAAFAGVRLLDATVDLTNVTTVTSSGDIDWDPSQTKMPAVTTITAPILYIVGNTSATLPGTLTTVAGKLSVWGNVTGLSASKLASVNGLVVTSVTNFSTLSLPALRTDNGEFTFTHNPNLARAAIDAVRNAITTGPTTTTICSNLGDAACQ